MNITVILPIHEIDDSVYKMTCNAISSYNLAKNESTRLMIVVSQEVYSFKVNNDKCFGDIQKESGFDVLVCEQTSFQSMINFATEHCNTEYFSILEYDDTYTKNAFTSVEKYANSKYEASVYIPLTEIVNYDTNEEYGYVNEAPLASAFSQELNYLDFECMEDFPEMNFTGSVFKLSDFIDAGKLKESMKLHFWHEYALRALNLGQKMFVVPKVGYKHTVNRKESFFGTLSSRMTQEECVWWFDLAKKEYLFKKDRNKTYE